eukprot:3675567-Amphidinium_carterae.1
MKAGGPLKFNTAQTVKQITPMVDGMYPGDSLGPVAAVSFVQGHATAPGGGPLVACPLVIQCAVCEPTSSEELISDYRAIAYTTDPVLGGLVSSRICALD